MAIHLGLLHATEIEITSLAGGAYGIFARVRDVSEIERASAASE